MSSTLNILHPSSRKDRYELLMKQLEQQKITDYKLWDNPIGQSMVQRRSLVCSGHKKIVQHAKDNNLKSVIIAENDITFFGDGAWDYYLKNIPEDYDIYFGMIYVGEIKDNRVVSESSGFTLYMVNERFYDRFLAAPPDKHIDRTITSLWEQYKFMVCPKFVCHQNDTQSDNTMGRPDLTKYLKGRELFGND